MWKEDKLPFAALPSLQASAAGVLTTSGEKGVGIPQDRAVLRLPGCEGGSRPMAEVGGTTERSPLRAEERSPPASTWPQCKEKTMPSLLLQKVPKQRGSWVTEPAWWRVASERNFVLDALGERALRACDSISNL